MTLLWLFVSIIDLILVFSIGTSLYEKVGHGKDRTWERIAFPRWCWAISIIACVTPVVHAMFFFIILIYAGSVWNDYDTKLTGPLGKFFDFWTKSV